MKNTNKNITKTALIDALATVVYVALVALFLFYVPRMLTSFQQQSALVPIFMLLLFVFSAALTGIFVFGKPVIWYLDGKKKEALSLIGCTLLFIFLCTLVAFLVYLFIAV